MVIMNYPFETAHRESGAHKTKARMNHAGLGLKQRGSGLVLGLQHLAATVEAGGADVMTQVRFARGGLHCDARHVQCIVRAVHAALGRRFFILLNGHGWLLVLKRGL